VADDAVAYVVRHGAHDWLRPGANRLAGRLPGIPLNDEGRREAEHVAALLAAQPIRWIVSSPIQRTLETAEIIARPHGLPVEHDDRFIESGLGPWQGRWVAEIQAEDPDVWRMWREDPTLVRLPGMEPVEEIAARMEAGCLDALARGGAGVIVSHQDPIAALLCRLIAMPMRAIRRWDVRTGSVAVVRRSADGVLIEAVNTGLPLVP
jgi:broad specificity phosphatase PhoE